MAMDPERPVEKMLRAAAEARRKAAGNFELHPATRRLLQGEVARRYSRSQRGTWRWTAWVARVWPRFVWAGGSVTVVLVAMWLLVPWGSRTDKEVQLAQNLHLVEPGASHDSAPPAVTPAVPSAAATPQPEPLLLAQRSVPESQSEIAGFEKALAQGRQAAVAQEKAAGTLFAAEEASSGATAQVQQNLTKQPPALAPAAAVPLDRDLLALSRTTPSNWAAANAPEIAAAVTLNSSPPLSRVEAAALPPNAAEDMKDRAKSVASEQLAQLGALYQTNAAALAFRADAPHDQGTAAVVQRFVRKLPLAKSMVADNLSSSAATLVSFRVEQSGPSLRVVDQDGSVYSGYLQGFEAQGGQAGANLRTSASTRAFSPALTRVQSYGSAGRSAERSGQSQYSFRVAGTNRTGQQVIFSGTLQPRTNAPGWVTGINAKLESQPASPLVNSDISGKVVIGGKPPMDLQATPAK